MVVIYSHCFKAGLPFFFLFLVSLNLFQMIFEYKWCSLDSFLFDVSLLLNLNLFNDFITKIWNIVVIVSAIIINWALKPFDLVLNLHQLVLVFLCFYLLIDIRIVFVTIVKWLVSVVVWLSWWTLHWRVVRHCMRDFCFVISVSLLKHQTVDISGVCKRNFEVCVVGQQSYDDEWNEEAHTFICQVLPVINN